MGERDPTPVRMVGGIERMSLRARAKWSNAAAVLPGIALVMPLHHQARAEFGLIEIDFSISASPRSISPTSEASARPAVWRPHVRHLNQIDRSHGAELRRLCSLFADRTQEGDEQAASWSDVVMSGVVDSGRERAEMAISNAIDPSRDQVVPLASTGLPDQRDFILLRDFHGTLPLHWRTHAQVGHYLRQGPFLRPSDRPRLPPTNIDRRERVE